MNDPTADAALLFTTWDITKLLIAWTLRVLFYTCFYALFIAYFCGVILATIAVASGAIAFVCGVIYFATKPIHEAAEQIFEDLFVTVGGGVQLPTSPSTLSPTQMQKRLAKNEEVMGDLRARLRGHASEIDKQKKRAEVAEAKVAKLEAEKRVSSKGASTMSSSSASLTPEGQWELLGDSSEE